MKTPFAFSAAFLAAATSSAFALSPGSLAFTTLNADEDGWAMVALTDIPASTTVYFTDNEWDGVSAFNGGEGYHRWESGGSLIAAGTVIRFSAVDSSTLLAASAGTLSRQTVSGSTGYGLSAGEESVYAYQGATATAPATFIAAICNRSFGTTAAGSIANTGLTLGNGAIQTGFAGGSDFAQYTGARSGQLTFAAYLPLVSNIANWTDNQDGDFGALLPNTTSFTLGVDLSKYVRVGRYDLPVPINTSAPTDNLLAKEASGVTYNWDTGTLFIVGDGGTSVTEVSKTGALVSTMTLALAGAEFLDTEGITYIGGGQFVMTEERVRQAVKFTYVAGGTLTRAAAETVKLGTTIGNVGLEGLSYDPQTSGFLFAKELEPEGLFQTTIDFAAGTASNGSPVTVNSTNLFEPALADLEDMSDVFAFSNLPSMTGQLQAGNLLILSQESGLIRNVDRSGNIFSTLTLVADAGNPLTIQNQTHEGITMDRDGMIYVVSENGGGDIDHPQLWVYAPSTAVNLAPSALALSTPSITLPEDTSTTAAIKMATLVVTDADGVGVNAFSVSGPDAASFQIIGTGLYLKAGTALNFTTKPTYNVTVNVDDTTVGSTPDAFAEFTLNLNQVVSGSSSIRITEVAPWSSGFGAVGADWFELTNIGSSAVDITGWKMYDSGTGGFASSGALGGVTSIAPGESVIFIENPVKIPDFLTNWFGANSPANLQIGSYPGPGLSSGGDGVNIYDASGTVKASVTFGASTPAPGPFLTFDNTVGLDNAAITQLSSFGQNGALAAAATVNEIGSPGTAVVSSTAIVSITATDASAAEAAADPGTFRMTRTGATTSAMTVVYSITTGAGHATSDDYSPVLTSPATIPANESFVDITVTPVDDLLVEGPETVVLTLGDTGSYDVGLAASATVTISDNDPANQPPTLVALNNTITVLRDSTSTASPIKVADIAITDDGQGTNNLTLAGTDAASFEITGSALYLKAGTALSYAIKPSYSVTVEVDDTAVGSTPDASVGFTLGIVPDSIFITEVNPGGSGASYAADWFEVTNTGSSSVNISGWQMDDSSNGTGKLALRGVTTIPAGRSAIFFEGTATGDTDPTIKASFSNAWFGSSTLPGGFLIGSYGGSGAGLSGTADAVNLFDSAGNRVTGVSFGAVTAGTTFENNAGLGSLTLPLPAVTAVSVTGSNGAFRSVSNTETGSPGNITNNSGTFPAWLASRGYTSTGINTDTDGDGLIDQLEYFFNLNPNDGGDFSNLPQVSANGGALQLGFTLLNGPSSLTGSLEYSGDLATWTPALPGLDYTLASSVVNSDETSFTYALPGTGPSAPGNSATYLTPNTSDPLGASLGAVRVVNEGLVGVGRLSGESLDKFGETQGAASGLFITDWAYGSGQFSGTFHVLPDRGHGDGTSNYAARLHEVDFSFAPYYGSAPVGQNQVALTYADSEKFTYQDGATVKFTTGLNPTGTSTLFGQTVGTITTANGPLGAQESLLSFDAEAVHLFDDGSGFVSDEYGTYIARFNAAKRITGLTQLPGAAQPFRPAGTPNFDSVTAPTHGRRNNQGLEGMSVTPDGTTMFALLQSSTVQDSNSPTTANQQTRNHARLFVYNIAGANRENPVLTGEYIVRLPQIDLDPNTAPSTLNGTAAQSEIVALGQSSFLMLPRDGNGLGKGTLVPITFKSVQLVDFASATNILGLFDGIGQAVSPAGVLTPGVNAAATAEVINMLQPDDLAKFGLNTTIPANANTLNEKIEGMALVPDVSTPQANDFFLFVANDNDFQSSDVKMLNAAGAVVSKGDGRLNAGITNDAMFYVWRLTIDAGGKKFFRMDVTGNN